MKLSTPLKVNMEPTNHPCEKENNLPSTSIFGFNMLISQCVSIKVHESWASYSIVIARSPQMVVDSKGILQNARNIHRFRIDGPTNAAFLL